MDKVKVSREIVEAMNSAFKKYTFRDAMTIHVNASWGKQHKCLNELSVEDMAKAYLVGYEAEQTPEEKWAILYAKHKRSLIKAEGEMIGNYITLQKAVCKQLKN